MRSSLPCAISSCMVSGSTGTKPTRWNTSTISVFLMLRSMGELELRDGHMFTCGGARVGGGGEDAEAEEGGQAGCLPSAVDDGGLGGGPHRANTGCTGQG
jgi:hypothetical protein